MSPSMRGGQAWHNRGNAEPPAAGVVRRLLFVLFLLGIVAAVAALAVWTLASLQPAHRDVEAHDGGAPPGVPEHDDQEEADAELAEWI